MYDDDPFVLPKTTWPDRLAILLGCVGVIAVGLAFLAIVAFVLDHTLMPLADWADDHGYGGQVLDYMAVGFIGFMIGGTWMASKK